MKEKGFENREDAVKLGTKVKLILHRGSEFFYKFIYIGIDFIFFYW